MKKHIITLIIFLIAANVIFAQNASLSVLTAQAYMSNPKKYLSKLDTNKFPTKILIDRTFPEEDLSNYNGNDKVKNCDYTLWRKLYTSVVNSHNKYKKFKNLSLLDSLYTFNYKYKSLLPISIINVKYNKIKQQAITDGDLAEVDTCLKDIHSSTNSYSTNRLICSSVLTNNTYGDNITFILPRFLYITNTYEAITSMQADFGNGYQSINFDEEISIQYTDESKSELVKIKFELINHFTNETTTLYTHFYFFRKGSSTVPIPDDISNVNNNKSINRPHPNLYTQDVFLYPEGSTRGYYSYISKYSMLYLPYTDSEGNTSDKPIDCNISPCYMGVCHEGYCQEEYREYTWIPASNPPPTLEIAVLFNPANPTKDNTQPKFRRPLVLCDGFDPGDSRDYYGTHPGKNPLPYDNDTRGLYELLNGNNSPWYPTYTPNLITSLQNSGYDIIFVNFLDGADDIFSNAAYLRDFFKNYLNSPRFRDNQTEEIVLIGPSMGGIITRLILNKMEAVGEKHHVKTWISFDSPQKGAYIPIGLQYTLQWLSDMDESAENGLKVLNTPAARQMLLKHYSNNYANPCSEHISLYNELGEKFPKFSKNYSITNGGLDKLYWEDGAEIIDFKYKLGWCDVGITAVTIKAWGNHNDNSSHNVFERLLMLGTNPTAYTYNQIGYENAPGGWNSALYTFGYIEDNCYRKSDIVDQYAKSSFIITASAFGKDVTTTSARQNWKQFTNCNNTGPGTIWTPFDEITGQEGDNEQHVNISQATADYLNLNSNDLNSKGKLLKDFENSTYPPIRVNQTTNQVQSGKTAYRNKETMTFAGNGNKFTIDANSDITAKAGKEINFEDGFEVKEGAEFEASIDNVTYDYNYKSISLKKSKPIDYTKKTEYIGKIYDYSSKTNKPTLLDEPFIFEVSPNPTFGDLKLNLTGGNKDMPYIIKIYNTLGILLFTETIKTPGVYEINISTLNKGVYIIKVTNNNKEVNKKIVKQ